MPESRSEEIDTFVAECETLVYAPDASADAPLEARWSARARELVDAIERNAS